MSRNDRVIVIGAGISGLSAAKLLKESGLEITVLEARDRVGGRTHTIRDEKYGGYTDVGGAYVGPTQRRVARMAMELGLEFYKVDETRRTIMDMQGVRMKYYGTIPPITSPLVAMDLNYLQYKLNQMSAEVPCDEPWRAPHALQWDAITYRQFIQTTCWTKFTCEAVALVCKAVLCVEPQEVSLLYILWYIASGQGVQRITTISNGAQERKFVGGAMGLSERLAERVGVSNVKLSQPVIHIQQSDAMVTVTTATGDTYQGAHVISALPLALLNRVCFDPPLPPLKFQLIQRIPMGSIIKTMAFYKTAFWKERDLCGMMATDRGPVLYCIDDTKPDGKAPCIMGFVLAHQARQLTDLTEEERKQCIVEHYSKLFQCDDFLHPVDYVEKNWMAEEYSGGCYVSALPPGVLTEFGHVLRDPFRRVHFAGTETATCWAGYMDGAIQAGERAAREILHKLGNITSEEIHQEEPPSDYFLEPPVTTMFIERVLPSVGQFLLMCVGAVLTLVAGVIWSQM